MNVIFLFFQFKPSLWFYSIFLSLFLIGCNNGDTSTLAKPVVAPIQPSVESSSETPSNITQQTSNSRRTLIPKFILACSYGSQNSNNQNRFISDSLDVYFGHENGSAFSKGKEINISDRVISFIQTDPSGLVYSSNIITELHRDTLKVWATRTDFTGKEAQQVYICESIEYDDDFINLIKSDFEAKKQRALDERRAYENRPNKI